MPINSQQPNSEVDINRLVQGAENILDRTSQTTPNILTSFDTPGRDLQRRIGMLDEMVGKLNKPILKSLANDMLVVMSRWLNDPEVLCCLIQGIYAAYNANRVVLDPEKEKVKLEDTSFAKFLDTMIVLIDFIIIFLTEDIKRICFLIPDIIKMLMNSIMGAVLLAIQETIYKLRDSSISYIFDWIDSWDTDQVWAKCLPLKQMISVLSKYIDDFGMIAKLAEKIKGFVAGQVKPLEDVSNKLIPNVQDLEFLMWLRNLLIKLKSSVLNADFCVDYEFVRPLNSDSDTPPTTRKNNGNRISIDNVLNPVTDFNDPNKIQNYTTGADGSIVINGDSGNWIPRVSNSFLREFIHNEYGLPYEVIENTLTRGSSADSIQGTNITSNNQMLLDKCANTPTAKETLRWILNIKSR